MLSAKTPVQIMYTIADAIQVSLEYKAGLLYGEGKVDLDILKGLPVNMKVKIIDGVLDDACGVVGALLKVSGNMYLAMISDDRVGLLTFFLVDGPKAGFVSKINKHGRLGIMDSWSNWSRKKFYSLIAPGVRATFTRNYLEDTWDMESVGPDAALAYVKKREVEDQGISAEDLNKKFQEDRQKRLSWNK